MKPLWLALVLTTLLPYVALAHRASDSFLALVPTSDAAFSGHWDVALSDLDYALNLDSGHGALTWGELRARRDDLTQLLRAGLRFTGARAACAFTVGELALIQLSDGPYARVAFDLSCPGAGSVRLTTSLLAEVDRDHRILLRLGNGDEAATYVLGRSETSLVLPLALHAGSRAAPLHALLAQVGRGLSHIFEGADHIAFLLVLLLPAVFRSKVAPRVGRSALVSLSIEIAKLVSAFTLAHSFTLSLAALGVVRTSADVIEPAIAASVALAALSNLWPRLAQEGYLLAFALGLLHGFGFSSALADVGLSGSALIASLLGFNLGVELGQLAIVALFVPLALLLARLRVFRAYALPWGSAAVLALALFWVFQRLQTG